MESEPEAPVPQCDVERAMIIVKDMSPTQQHDLMVWMYDVLECRRFKD